MSRFLFAAFLTLAFSFSSHGQMPEICSPEVEADMENLASLIEAFQQSAPDSNCTELREHVIRMTEKYPPTIHCIVDKGSARNEIVNHENLSTLLSILNQRGC